MFHESLAMLPCFQGIETGYFSRDNTEVRVPVFSPLAMSGLRVYYYLV